MHRALLVSLLLSVTVLAGCASSKDDAPTDADDLSLPNVGGSDKVVTSVFPGSYNFTGPYSRVLTPGTLAIKPPVRVTTPSPIDGADIEMGLFLPDTGEPVPIMVFATPYLDAEDSVTRQEAEAVAPVPVPQNPVAGKPNPPPTVVSPSVSVKSLIDNLVPHGYAFVTLSVRGTGGSDGCNDLMGPNEVADLDAALTWMGEQPWSTGKIAMIGVSYDGSTPWSAAATGNPYLKTIVPVSGVPDMYGLMYRNGSSEARGPFLLNALYIQGGIDSGEPEKAPGRLCPEAVEGLALSGLAGAAGEDPTGYWQARNRKPGVEANYKGSVFSIQGLQDWNVDPSQVVPWVDQLEAKGLRTKQLLGQWGHAWPDGLGVDGTNVDCDDDNGKPDVCVRADFKEILLRWLDQELKGLPVDTGAPVQVRDDLGRWRNEEHYPPRDAAWTTYHLGNGLLLDQSGERASAVLYPQAGAPCVVSVAPCGRVDPPNPPAADLAVQEAADFALGPLAEDLLITGLPKVHVTVTPQGPGGYMGAYLYDVDEDGVERRIGWTTMNLAFADGSTTRSEVVPGETIRAMMEIQPMDSVVEAGHQLVLRIWVFTDADRLPTIPPGPVALEMGQGVESTLVLPTVVRGPEVYFTPPAPAKDPDA